MAKVILCHSIQMLVQHWTRLQPIQVGCGQRLTSFVLFQSAVVFPTKIATEQQSLMLVKRLLAVAVSCITYLRGIFPESAYRTRYMDGNRLVSCCFAKSIVKGLLRSYWVLLEPLGLNVMAIFSDWHGNFTETWTVANGDAASAIKTLPTPICNADLSLLFLDAFREWTFLS